MEVEVTNRTVEIESNYYLMQVFNAINQDKSSLTFVFNNIRFWREDHMFMIDRHNQTTHIGEVFDFEEFKRLIQQFDSRP